MYQRSAACEGSYEGSHLRVHHKFIGMDGWGHDGEVTLVVESATVANGAHIDEMVGSAEVLTQRTFIDVTGFILCESRVALEEDKVPATRN
jgi:hypothetical protein